MQTRVNKTGSKVRKAGRTPGVVIFWFLSLLLNSFTPVDKQQGFYVVVLNIISAFDSGEEYMALCF